MGRAENEERGTARGFHTKVMSHKALQGVMFALHPKCTVVTDHSYNNISSYLKSRQSSETTLFYIENIQLTG